MKKKKRVKVKFKRILIFLLCVIILGFGIYKLLNLKITNIYVSGEMILNEQDVIDIALISDYPNTFSNFSRDIENRLSENIYIKEVNVSKRWFTEVYIDIVFNKPLFYYNHINQTVLSDGQVVDDIFVVPTVLNYITDSYYDEFMECLYNLDSDILSRISEIEFKPNEVDDNRFLLSMTDGNYVYVNISTFDKMNKYLEFMTSLPKENGILYLDYGNNFVILE